MGLTSNTGLLASVPQKMTLARHADIVDLRCQVAPAPFLLRPYAGLFNPFSHACSILCNHPADTEAKQYVRRAKDAWASDNKTNYPQDELMKLQEKYAAEREKGKFQHEFVTEEMFRRYAENDSRPLTPAPTLASGKSKGSRRCLTPDQPHQRTKIVLDLRRSHSQETLYYHGCTTSEITGVQTTSATIDRSTLPSLNLSEGVHARLLKGQCEQLPPLASPLVLSKRNAPQTRETASVKTARKNQLKALNLGKMVQKAKNKAEPPSSQRSKTDKEGNDGSEDALAMDDAGEVRRRGKRRRKGRQPSDRMTSAGLAAQSQQDPETQIAGIGTDSHNPSSRASIAPTQDFADDVIALPAIKVGRTRKTDSFLDDDILKYLHREVDEEAIETEFDDKRRYVLEEALRTRPERPYGQEMQTLLKEYKVSAVSLGDWLHIPRVFSRQSSRFSLPIDTHELEALTPMKYAASFVTLKKSKQLLYFTVLRRLQPEGYRIPIDSLEEGLMLMMGGILSKNQCEYFKAVMEWDIYEEEKTSNKLKPASVDSKEIYKGDISDKEDTNEGTNVKTLKYKTWCGLCAICERMYGRFPSRDKDPPDGMELSDFSLLETKLVVLNVHGGLVELLNAIRLR